MNFLRSNPSRRPLIPPNSVHPSDIGSGDPSARPFFRDASNLTTDDIRLPDLLDRDGDVGEQTLYQVEIVNEKLLRKSKRSQLASKNKCLTRRWQTALISTLLILGLAGGIGGLIYWLSIPKTITKPYLLYGEECYMNSRSCDATRGLWCPAGVCICLGDFQWDSTAKNCTCGASQFWDGFKCQHLGYYGDPCNLIPCAPSLTCTPVISQKYTTSQSICVCDSLTYLSTSGPTRGQCVPRLSYNQVCETNSDCQNWLGLSCTNSGAGLLCLCGATGFWNGSICTRNAYGWEYCSVTVPCETTLGLTCVSNACECNSLSFWDNVTTISCLQKRTYSIPCDYNFQCKSIVGLTCPTNSTGCNCPKQSYGQMCDCQGTEFWDGEKCVTRHTFNGTCPGQYACVSNLVCFLGHCVCPGNMLWGVLVANQCDCPVSTAWDPVKNLCV